MTVEYDKRDKYGNVEHVTAKDGFGAVRESTTIWDNEGVFPVKEINALGHESELAYDRRFGSLNKTNDPNGLVTEWRRDSLGRETLEKRPDGSETATTLARTKINGGWQMSVQTKTTGGADNKMVLDCLGRTIETFTYGPTPVGQQPQGQKQIFVYDRLSGQLERRSVLAAENTPDAELKWDEYAYDSIRREIRHITPWNVTTTTAYEGFVIDSTDALLQHTVTKIDALGRPVIITDAAKGKTSYVYGPFNTLQSVTDPGGAITKWSLDALDRPRSITDPDRGTTLLVHNGFGDVVASTDALGRTTTFGLDAVGRVKTRIDKMGAQTLTTTWTWDTAPNGIGRLHSLASPDTIQTFSYTAKGQLEGMVQTVDGNSLAIRRHFDSAGRVKSIDYPQPLGETPFGVSYDFDERGFVIGVHEKNTQETFWTLREVDKAGRIQKERFGNGVETSRDYDNDQQTLTSFSTMLGATKIQQLSYTWDAQLNLKSRSDTLQVQNKTERFRYDELDRVTCAYFGAVENALTPCGSSYSYLPNGNLSAKSDVGGYAYLDPKHPHAVTNAAGEAYAYNAVGNQITRPGGTTITYTPFDLPKTITANGKTTSFGYDGEQKRIRKTSPTSDTLYFGEMFEQVTAANGGVERRYYVNSPERVIAVVTRGGANAGTKYLHVDHLGSVETLTNASGAIVEKRGYDVYGARRNSQWGAPGGVTSSKTTKGFTGHEDDEDLGLVNMRGRIMDPRLGRFTTTDPVIADVGNGQTLNRYSYVNGNPLSLVDPTGFSPDSPPIMPLGSRVGTTEIHIWYPPRKPPEDKGVDALESTNSLRFLGDVAPIGFTPGSWPQDTTEPEEDGFDVGEFLSAAVLGMGEGVIPFGGVGHSVADAFGLTGDKSDEAKLGLALGQIVGGTITLLGGLTGEFLGGVATVSGVGAAVGVPVMAVSTVAVVGGVGNIAAGLQGLASVMSGGGGSGTGSGPQGSSAGGRVGGNGSLAGIRVGHTFSKHGSENTAQLLKQAKGSGRPVGQWIDDAGAEDFIAKRLSELKNGAKSFDLPGGLGRMINPDGTFSPATRARLVPSGSGVKTAFPEP